MNGGAMPARTDAELLSALRASLRAGRVELRLDARRLDSQDSPVSVQAESTRWLYALVVASGAAWSWGGHAAGLAAGAASVACWYLWVRPDVARRISRRVEDVALDDAATWRRLWRHGGVALRIAGAVACVAPDGNWMQFVRDLDMAAGEGRE